jgi:hypothetical protein
VHSVQQTGAGNCEYGLLPGFLSLNVMKPAGARFQTASSQCALTNLMAPDAPTGRVKVMVRAWCRGRWLQQAVRGHARQHLAPAMALCSLQPAA